MEQQKAARMKDGSTGAEEICFPVTTSGEAHLIQVTYSIFIATVYMTTQDSLKVTNTSPSGIMIRCQLKKAHHKVQVLHNIQTCLKELDLFLLCMPALLIIY